MTFTSHGHHIPGTPYDLAERAKLTVARCGGVKLCASCGKDASKYMSLTNKAVPQVHFSEKARQAVVSLVNNHLSIEDPRRDANDFHTVWFAKTLENWRALVADLDTSGANLYYEVTHNGEKNETYIDVYEKIEQHVV